jgi:hypothetical protein
MGEQQECGSQKIVESGKEINNFFVIEPEVYFKCIINIFLYVFFLQVCI